MLDQITRNDWYNYERESYESALVTGLGGVLVNKTGRCVLDQSGCQFDENVDRGCRVHRHRLDLSIQCAESVVGH
jgi:hypothetical protein